MKSIAKHLLVILLGAAAHMLYMDYVKYDALKTVDSCMISVQFVASPQIQQMMAEQCNEAGNNKEHAHKGKGFGLYKLIHYSFVAVEDGMD